MEQVPLQTPPQSESSTSSRWIQFHGLFPLSLLMVLIVGLVRYFSFTHPIVFVLSTIGLLAGAFLAHLLFAEEMMVRKYLAQAVKDPELAQTHDSLLRHGLIVFLLPVLSLFALTSTRNPVGLGFIWGVMMVYSYDLLQFVRTRNKAFVEEYFHAFDVEANIQQGVAVGFVAFTVLFGVLLMASRIIVL